MNGNFLEYAHSKTGIDVGFGKMILVYGAKTAKAAADLTATAIQAEIEAGTIIGIIKGWHTVAGAPVAEISVERTGTAEMKLIRPEILADVLTFESGLASNEVLADLVKVGSLNCILIDDQGNCFGDYDSAAGKISTMLINFATKATSGMQGTNNTEKTVAVTVRYLVKDLSVCEAGTETELIESKTLLVGQLISAALIGQGEIYLLLKDKATNEFFDGEIVALDVSVKGTNVSFDDVTYNTENGVLAIVFEDPIAAGQYQITISGETFYMKETTFTIS